jgi:deazaflavin-dependent oxidoreductase (nitroreductase family)
MVSSKPSDCHSVLRRKRCVQRERGVPIPKKNDLKERLTRYRQIKITVVGRNSGKTISIPVWFVLERETLYLLPVRGSDTQWYENVLKEPKIRIEARDAEARVTAKPITESAAVKSVIERFREKYGTKNVKKYYSKFDVAVSVELG